MIKLTDQDFVEKTKTGYMVVDFYATWCGPCRMLHPVLEALEQEGKATIAQIDVDESPLTAKQYGVMSIPTLILFKDGIAIDQKIGFQSKSELEKWIAKNE